MQLSYTTLRIYEYALPQHFFSSFRSRKKCEETTRLAKGTWNVWNTLSAWPDSRFWSQNHTLGNPVGFFQFHRFTVNSHVFDGVGTETDHLFDGARGPHSDAMFMSDCRATSAALKGKWREKVLSYCVLQSKYIVLHIRKYIFKLHCWE